jgi:GNAT superfamily N-acetyltransferase
MSQPQTTERAVHLALRFAPVTAERWSDLERLFGPRGGCGGCWCMHWRQTRVQQSLGKGEPNRQALHAMVATGETPGILAYLNGTPIGWCAIAPRAAYPVLARSRTLKPVDDQPVWSITCLFVDRRYRRRGISSRLICAAVDYAASQGATIVEAYPIVPRTDHMPDPNAWTGIASTFAALGFSEVARHSPVRPIMRRNII